MTLKSVRVSVLSVLAVAGFVSACGEPFLTGPAAALAGLTAGATNDGNPITVPPADPTTGSFNGTVVGHLVLYNLTDTISLRPHIAGTRLTAYSHVPPTATDTLGVGLAVASVVSDANGQFQFPTLAGGLYIVTITPPPYSPYRGVWVTAVVQSRSDDYPWSVELPTK